HAHHRAEDLFLGDLHVVLDVDEHRRLDEVALAADAVAAAQQAGALALAGLDVAHDPLALLGADLRPLLGVHVERAAHLARLGLLHEAVDELVVDLALDEQPAAGAAALALVEEQAEVGALDGLVEVGVGEDDVGALAAQFEADALEVAAGGGLHDQLAGGDL